jgi:hypothetical protein
MKRDNILLHLPSFFIYFLFISSFCYCYWCFFNFSIPLLCRFVWRFNRMKNTKSLFTRILSLLQKNFRSQRNTTRYTWWLKTSDNDWNWIEIWTWIGWEQIHLNFSLHTHTMRIFLLCLFHSVAVHYMHAGC